MRGSEVLWAVWFVLGRLSFAWLGGTAGTIGGEQKRGPMKRNTLAFVLLASLAVVFTSHAQVTTGTISGTVADSTGAVLPGAKIEVQNEGTGSVRTVIADSVGHYTAPVVSG
jgi:Carboxypeptidase regulatory-like domain